MSFLDPTYLQPATADGSVPIPASASSVAPTVQSGPSPALPASTQNQSVAGAPLSFSLPLGSKGYFVHAQAVFAAGTPPAAVLTGVQVSVVAGQAGSTLSVTPFWAPTTQAAVGAGAAQHSVAVFPLF